MAKTEKTDISPKTEAKGAPDPQTGCVVCGGYAGSFTQVTPAARVHDACAAARPDVVAKVKARA